MHAAPLHGVRGEYSAEVALIDLPERTRVMRSACACGPKTPVFAGERVLHACSTGAFRLKNVFAVRAVRVDPLELIGGIHELNSRCSRRNAHWFSLHIRWAVMRFAQGPG